MHMSKTFAVVGGDLRQVHLSGLLAKDGFNVLAVGFDRDVEISPDVLRVKSASEAVTRADFVVLPLPFSLDGSTVNAPFSREPIPLDMIWGAAEGKIVTGGKLTEEVYAQGRKTGFSPIDYYKREELEIANTIPTAEGAIQIAMEELPVTIHGANCLVAGFGRVGKTLCRDLYGLGADVTACARKYSDLAWIRALQYHAVHSSALDKVIDRFDLIFNTVPAVIFTEKLLSKIKKNGLVIDLASKPGGVDFKTAGRLGVKTIWALSLPGKVAPLSSGQIIKDTILNILEEEGSK